MRSIIGRLIGVLGGGLIVVLTDTLGLDVTPEAAVAITDGLNLLGTGLFFVGYAAVHKAANHYIAPLDSAGVEPITDGLPPRAGR
jgi:hypothetical protein